MAVNMTTLKIIIYVNAKRENGDITKIPFQVLDGGGDIKIIFPTQKEDEEGANDCNCAYINHGALNELLEKISLAREMMGKVGLEKSEKEK